MNSELFVIPDDEIRTIGVESSVYGFPTATGMKQLVSLFNTIKSTHKIEYIYGIDLGCGDGLLINYLNTQLTDSTWDGVELSTYRIHASNYWETNTIHNCNLLELDYSLYNFIWVNNVCFEDDLCVALEQKLFTEFSGYFVFSKAPQNPVLYKHCMLLMQTPIEMNWAKKHNVYVYKIR